MVVLKQLTGEYLVKSSQLIEAFYEATRLIRELGEVEVEYIPQDQNEEANRMA